MTQTVRIGFILVPWLKKRWRNKKTKTCIIAMKQTTHTIVTILCTFAHKSKIHWNFAHSKRVKRTIQLYTILRSLIFVLWRKKITRESNGGIISVVNVELCFPNPNLLRFTFFFTAVLQQFINFVCLSTILSLIPSLFTRTPSCFQFLGNCNFCSQPFFKQHRDEGKRLSQFFRSPVVFLVIYVPRFTTRLES